MMNRIKSVAHAEPCAGFPVSLRHPGNMTPEQKVVIRLLAKLCHVNSSSVAISPTTQQTDPYAVFVSEGRREVFLHINHYLGLSQSDIAAMIAEEMNELNEDDNNESV